MFTALKKHPERRKYILAGTGIYFIFLFLLLALWVMLVTAIIPLYGYEQFPALFYLLIGFFIFPSIASSFTVSYWSKESHNGLFGVIIAGIIVFVILCVFLLFISILIITEPYTYSPTVPQPAFYLFLIYFIFFAVFIPVAGVSIVLALIAGKIGSTMGAKPAYERK